MTTPNRFRYRAWVPVDGNEWCLDNPSGGYKDKVNKMYHDVGNKAESAVALSYDQRDGASYAENVVLMQSTGLLDKNGKEIFENDVLRLAKDDVGEEVIDEVIFKDGCFVTARTLTRISFSVGKHGEDWEIIGNIYENPEILK